MNLKQSRIQILFDILNIKSFILGLIVGGFFVYVNTIYVHESPVGGFVFKDDKVYNLCEIDGTEVKLSVRGVK